MCSEENPSIINTLIKSAKKSPCTYKVSAVAFDKKGDILGWTSNSHSRNWNVLDKEGSGRPGTGQHAERKLMCQYGSNIKTIVICRVGRSGELRPIDPCEKCKKVAEKLGIKIISVTPGV